MPVRARGAAKAGPAMVVTSMLATSPVQHRRFAQLMLFIMVINLFEIKNTVTALSGSAPVGHGISVHVQPFASPL